MWGLLLPQRALPAASPTTPGARVGTWDLFDTLALCPAGNIEVATSGAGSPPSPQGKLCNTLLSFCLKGEVKWRNGV